MNENNKAENKRKKKIGQFFTDKNTAEFMSSMFILPNDIQNVRILDAGAGMGILACTFAEKLALSGAKNIAIDCYETDLQVIDALKENLESLCKKYGNVIYQIITQNFIDCNDFEMSENYGKYDFAIGNPPYVKLGKNDIETKKMKEICYGAPNLYMLFATMSLSLLKKDGEMVYLMPTSWVSGLYFKRFRNYFLSKGKIISLHLFESRSKVFGKQSVLQDVMIVKIKKTNITPEFIYVSSSEFSEDIFESYKFFIPYHTMVLNNTERVFLVANKSNMEILNKMHTFHHTLDEVGIRMRIGLVVLFRHKDDVSNEYLNGYVPMYTANHVVKGKISDDIEFQYINKSKKGLIQQNKNYLFIKRFSPKENTQRLQCGIYLKKEHMEHDYISTEMKLCFLEMKDKEDVMDEDCVYGLYVLFNSTLYNKYIGIINGTLNINAEDINKIPVPTLDMIKKMGSELMKNGDLSIQNCDKILDMSVGLNIKNDVKEEFF